MYQFIALLILVKTALTQPGGGGGIVICSFYNKHLNPIEISSDPAFRMRIFTLKDGNILRETYPFEVYRKPNHIGPSSGFYLRPAYLPNQEKYNVNSADQRLFIIYERDTMIVDFIGLISGNATKHRDGLDSLVVKPGYMRYVFDSVAYDSITTNVSTNMKCACSRYPQFICTRTYTPFINPALLPGSQNP